MQPSPEHVVDSIIRARGDQDASLQALGGLRRQPWCDDWRLAERIVRTVQERSEQGALNALERSALIGHFVDNAAACRAELDPRFIELEREMDRIEREYGGDDKVPFRLSDAPPEYAAMDDEQQAVIARVMADWLEELGEPDLARLARERPAGFNRMIVAGQLMLSSGTDDPNEVLDIEEPRGGELTAALAIVSAMRRTKAAASMFREIITDLWQSPDDIHAVATVRFTQELWKSGHLDDDERMFVINAIAEPMGLAYGLADSQFTKMEAALDSIHQRTADGRVRPGDKEEQEQIVAEFAEARKRLAAEWLDDDVDPEQAALAREDPAQYRQRCRAGARSLFGDHISEARVQFGSL